MIQTTVLLVGIGVLYCLGSRYYFRIDLTEDKRYSVHAATKTLLNALEDELYIEVYLTGDLPVELKQLKRATQELIEELKVYAPRPLRYQFIDLTQESSKEQKDRMLQLANKGIHPTHLYTQAKGQRTEKCIFPGALLRYQGREVGVLLLKGSKMVGPAQMVNQSIEGLEYELATALDKLIRPEPQKVGLLRGHGEPSLQQLNGLMKALKERYALHLVELSASTALHDYDALMITKPQQPFSATEQYLLDQYLMQGGKLLLFLDRLRIDIEHLRQQVAFAFPLNLGLEDQLFRYGIRINPDLVQDLQAGIYPLVVGRLGNQPQIQFLPWPFFPLLNHFSKHLITKNMDAIYPQFSSSIDLIQVPGIVHTPLAFTSQYTRKLSAPVHVDLESLRKPPQPAQYHHKHLPIAYLLEGTFTSRYKNRFLPEGVDTTLFMAHSQPTKLLVVSSGSLVLNGIDPERKRPLPWGYDPFLQQHFANRDFVLNVLAYMLNEEGLINLKNKSLKIRLLDPAKTSQERLKWQLINLIAPLAFLMLLALVWNYIARITYRR